MQAPNSAHILGEAPPLEPLFLSASTPAAYLEDRHIFTIAVREQSVRARKSVEKCVNGVSEVIFAAERVTLFAGASTPETAEYLLQPLAALALEAEQYATVSTQPPAPHPSSIPRQPRRARRNRVPLVLQPADGSSFEERLKELIVMAETQGLSHEELPSRLQRLPKPARSK
jgi:hypothetical protein